MICQFTSTITVQVDLNSHSHTLGEIFRGHKRGEVVLLVSFSEHLFLYFEPLNIKTLRSCDGGHNILSKQFPWMHPY